jgi:Na+:H+ antiporter, NhaA family
MPARTAGPPTNGLPKSAINSVTGCATSSATGRCAAATSPSAGVLLLIAAVLSMVLMNSALDSRFAALWEQPFGFILGGSRFRMSLLDWINEGLLTIFFLVVGLEIKREVTIGHLTSLRFAALPTAAAIGGMAAPAIVYALL